MQRRILILSAALAAAALAAPGLHDMPNALTRRSRRRRGRSGSGASASAKVTGPIGATSAAVVCDGEQAAETDPQSSAVSCQQ